MSAVTPFITPFFDARLASFSVFVTFRYFNTVSSLMIILILHIRLLMIGFDIDLLIFCC